MATNHPSPNRLTARSLLGYGISGLIGLGIYFSAGWAVPRAAVVTHLLSRKPNACSLQSAFLAPGAEVRFSKLYDAAGKEVRVLATDQKLPIEQVQTNNRTFWVKSSGQNFNGEHLISYLLAEHRWTTGEDPGYQVKPGDIVIDCGAHVGVFTDKALKLGAARVVSVEIDPVNIECLRRNFPQEIADGRVILYTKGVWSKDGTMPFTVAKTNSGMGSLVIPSGSETIQVSLTTLDKIAEELRLPVVNYIKMDIEGAEREALAGSLQTLRKHRPTLMLDFYHLPDDPVVLPRVVRSGNPAYQEYFGPCERSDEAYRPHVVYFR